MNTASKVILSIAAALAALVLLFAVFVPSASAQCCRIEFPACYGIVTDCLSPRVFFTEARGERGWRHFGQRGHRRFFRRGPFRH